MSGLFLYMIIGAGVLGIFIIIFGVYLLRRSEGDALSKRINEYAAREELASIEEIELSLSFSERILVPMVQRLSNLVTRFAPQKVLDETTKQIEMGGKKLSAAEFWAMVFAAILFMSALGFFAAPAGRGLIGLGIGALAGFLFPRMWLTSAVSKRQNDVIKKLPDALDLMSICVDAGVTFDGAMAKVNDKWDDPLSKEFGRVVHEIQLGKTRRQSLKDMSDRLGVPDVQSFIASVLQADQLGVSIGRILKIQSEQMRLRRRQRAEEQAQKAPIKMLFPMVFLIFPAMFVVLLGPAGFRVYRTFYID